MEESLNSSSKSVQNDFMECFNMDGVEARQLSPLVLAYIGDSVFDLIVKSRVIKKKGNIQVNKLNKYSSNLVKAQSQSELIGIIEESLTEDELSVYKRGRNAKSYTSAKNATITDYRRATGLEALFGYLYITKQYSRMIELVEPILGRL